MSTASFSIDVVVRSTFTDAGVLAAFAARMKELLSEFSNTPVAVAVDGDTSVQATGATVPPAIMPAPKRGPGRPPKAKPDEQGSLPLPPRQEGQVSELAAAYSAPAPAPTAPVAPAPTAPVAPAPTAPVAPAPTAPTAPVAPVAPAPVAPAPVAPAPVAPVAPAPVAPAAAIPDVKEVSALVRKCFENGHMDATMKVLSDIKCASVSAIPPERRAAVMESLNKILGA